MTRHAPSPIAPCRSAREARPSKARACLAAFAAVVSFFSTAAAQFRVPEGLPPERAARFARFADFRINGVCGTEDLDRLSTYGVNTVRGYTIPSPEKMRAELDKVHSLGMKMVVSEWMAHHGENKARDGTKWTYDYNERGDELVAQFIKKVEGIGDHPALLMWGLGNEVHLDEPYLRTVNRMSEAVHERFPLHLTSLTMVNAKPEAIAAVKRWAPDLDVLGVQSYSPGAVRGAIKSTEQHWGLPFYFSEFNGKGPWNFPKTEWGETLDEPVPQKVADLKACYEAIDASPLCLGSTVFIWGNFGVDRPTYFSLLLAEKPSAAVKNKPFTDLLMTPQAEAMVEHFTGKPFPGNRAPFLTAAGFAGGERSATAAPSAAVTLQLAGEDPEGDPVRLVCWVLGNKSARYANVAGPYEADASGRCDVPAPSVEGDYLIMAYAMDGRGGGSASTLPLAVRAGGVQPAPSPK